MALKKSSLIPTKKWIVATVTGVVGLGLMLLTGDPTVTDPEKIALGTFLVQRVAAWAYPNAKTPGGVPIPGLGRNKRGRERGPVA